MNIETMALKFIKPYENNAKLHPKEQIEQIKRSIDEFGFNDPIAIDENDTIIEGHGRYIALLQLGYTEAPVIRLSHLTEAQKKAYIIAHNKLTLNSDFDMDLILKELDEIKIDLDPTITGFDLSELDNLLDTDEVVEDEFEIEVPQEPESKLGDLWLLDGHRLLCGDSTSDDDVKRLIDGNTIDVVFTDPPYNINYQDLKHKHEKIKNDKMQDESFYLFLEKSLKHIKENSYICCNWKYYHIFYQVLEKLNKPVKSCIVWDKETRVQNLDKYFKQHEFILYTGKLGGEKTIRGDVFKLKREKSDLHPTMKPLELVSTFIKDGSQKNDTVLDLFGGSGSTLIASEQVNRQCYMMELDPKYIDVIVKRYEAFKLNADIKLIRDGNTYSYDDIFGGEA